MLTRTAAFVALMVVATGQMSCSTSALVNKFNSGILDSSGDPFHDPSQRKRELVRELLTHEFMDGFFTQGSPDGRIVTLVREAGLEPQAFAAQVLANARFLGSYLPWSTAPLPAEFVPFTTASLSSRDRTAALGRYIQDRAPASVPGPICGTDGELETKAAATIADELRFNAALERATADVTAIAVEGLVGQVDVEEGARQAFTELTRYLGGRTWQRRFDRRVNGLVIKGGASTGLYSAGVVWVALNLIAKCMADDQAGGCHALASDPRFALVSGTSTGAMIAVATELFNAAATDSQRGTALDNLAGWFTCVGDNDLYCVQNGDALNMLKTQTGMLHFDGIQTLLAKNLRDCEVFKNSSELVLNTVDFRTGTLFDLSDQDELRSPNDIVQGAIASAVLPFIAAPVQHLPVDYSQTQVEAYLDGGVRSELPILPLIRRGAERVLVVSSDASVTDESNQLANGMDIAIRFIDVVVGGVTESEIQHAERHVESVRLAEIDACTNSAETKNACSTSSSPSDCEAAFCRGDWAQVCSGKAPPKAVLRTTLDLTDQRIASLWGMRSFFRNETEVSGLHGYDFDSSAERRLFLAGAEAARVRCGEIARLLGLPIDKLGSKLADWCAPVLKPGEALCRSVGLSSNSTGLRNCSATPPPSASNVGCR